MSRLHHCVSTSYKHRPKVHAQRPHRSHAGTPLSGNPDEFGTLQAPEWVFRSPCPDYGGLVGQATRFLSLPRETTLPAVASTLRNQTVQYQQAGILDPYVLNSKPLFR